MARKPRTQKIRRIRRTFYVFCEGKTEKAYIEYLRQTLRPEMQLTPIICKSNISQKEIDSNLNLHEVHPEDRLFIMFDLDVAGMYDRVSSIKNATLLVSNPCLELWYLLHFADCKKYMTSDNCIDGLKQQVKGYRKGAIEAVLYSALYKNMENAIKRAKELQTPENPSTTVWRIIESISQS